jgi:type I restriction enzyme R subunit
VHEKEKARLREILERVNELFDGELTDSDKLVYVDDVLRGKLMESEVLRQQASNNTKQQFATSPDLRRELVYAIMAAMDAHTSMSTQALDSDRVQEGILRILLGPSRLYESLRGTA